VAVVLTRLPALVVAKVVVSSVVLSVVYRLGVSMLGGVCHFLPQGSLKYSVEHVVEDSQETLFFYFFSCVGAGCIAFLYCSHSLALPFWLALALSLMIQLSLPALANYVCSKPRRSPVYSSYSLKSIGWAGYVCHKPRYLYSLESIERAGDARQESDACTEDPVPGLNVVGEKIYGPINERELELFLWSCGCLDGAYTSITQGEGRDVAELEEDVSPSGGGGRRAYVRVSSRGWDYSLYTIDPSSLGKGEGEQSYAEARNAIGILYVNHIILQATCDYILQATRDYILQVTCDYILQEACDDSESSDLCLLRASHAIAYEGADGMHAALAEQNPSEGYQPREFVQENGKLSRRLVSFFRWCCRKPLFLDYDHAVVVTSLEGQQQLIFRLGTLRSQFVGSWRSVLFGFGSSQDLANAERADPPSFTGGRGLIGLFENPTVEMFLGSADENSILGAEIDLRDLVEDAVQKQKEYVAQCRSQETVLSSEGEG